MALVQSPPDIYAAVRNQLVSFEPEAVMFFCWWSGYKAHWCTWIRTMAYGSCGAPWERVCMYAAAVAGPSGKEHVQALDKWVRGGYLAT